MCCREATSQHAMGDEWTPCPAIPGTITGAPSCQRSPSSMHSASIVSSSPRHGYMQMCSEPESPLQSSL